MPVPKPFPSFAAYEEAFIEGITELVGHAPSLKNCLLADSGAMSCEHLKHAVSMDADWHTKKAHHSPNKTILELKKSYGQRFKLFMADNEYGLYRGEIKLFTGHVLAVDIFSSSEDQRSAKSKVLPGVSVPLLEDYIDSKISCVNDRQEVKDLYHLCALDKAGLLKEKHWAQADPIQVLEGITSGREEWPKVKKLLLPLKGQQSPKEADFLSWLADLEVNLQNKISNSFDIDL